MFLVSCFVHLLFPMIGEVDVEESTATWVMGHSPVFATQKVEPSRFTLVEQACSPSGHSNYCVVSFSATRVALR